MKIGFIGAGKVGMSLGKYFQGNLPNGYELSGYYSKNQQSARWAADFTESDCYSDRKAVVEASDILFITVPDAMIAEVAGKIATEFSNEEIAGKCICHCSGAETSEVFQPLREKGAYGYSVHPLCAVSSKEFGYIALKESCFTVEGDEKYLEELHNLFRELGNPIEIINPDMKVKYHMAAVFASNLVVGLYEQASKMLEECGLSKEFSKTALIPLFLNNAKNIAEKGCIEALTGPVERADIETMKKHLQAVSDEESEFDIETKMVYRLLSQRLVSIAQQKNPDRDYEPIKKLLE